MNNPKQVPADKFAEYLLSVLVGFLVAQGRTPEQIGAFTLRCAEMTQKAARNGMMEEFAEMAKRHSEQLFEGENFQDPT